MREIIFRAKKWDSSEWVYGDLIQGGEDGSKWILPIRMAIIFLVQNLCNGLNQT